MRRRNTLCSERSRARSNALRRLGLLACATTIAAGAAAQDAARRTNDHAQ
jgi:hypothetical protein